MSIHLTRIACDCVSDYTQILPIAINPFQNFTLSLIVFIMDKIDRSILVALQADGSLSHAELAERVGASTASCWRRIKALEASGILLKTVRLVDAERVGCNVNVMCHVRMRSHALDVRAAFEAFVAARGEVLECYSMSGEWDYLLRIVARDIAGYERFLMRTLLEHTSVATCSSHFAMSQTKYTTELPIW